jgi:hypothetical protein
LWEKRPPVSEFSSSFYFSSNQIRKVVNIIIRNVFLTWKIVIKKFCVEESLKVVRLLD